MGPRYLSLSTLRTITRQILPHLSSLCAHCKFHGPPIRWGPTKTFIPSIFSKHFLSIYYGTRFLSGHWKDSSKQTERVLPLLQLLFHTFLLLSTCTRCIMLTFNLRSQLSPAFCFMFLRFGSLWEKSRDHVLFTPKVCVHFSWLITATKGSLLFILHILGDFWGCNIPQQSPTSALCIILPHLSPSAALFHKPLSHSDLDSDSGIWSDCTCKTRWLD